MNLFWLPLAFLSALFAALVAIFGKLGVAALEPAAATFLRAVIMSLFLLLVMVVSGKIGNLTAVGSKELLWVILSGLAGAASWLFYFWALKFGPAARVATVDRLSLVLVAILAFAFLGERFSWLAVIGLVLVVVGAYLVSFK